MINLLDFFFFFFSTLSIGSGIFMILSKNPLHSILFLILIFANSVFLLLVQEIEFLSMVFLIVYIGAIAILFLFVVYMLNIRLIELNEVNIKYILSIGLSFIIFFIYFCIFFNCQSLLVIDVFQNIFFNDFTN